MKRFPWRGTVNTVNELSRVCLVLKKHNVKYIIAGARACGLHGYVRATEDIDVLIQKSEENILKVIQCIEELYPHLEKITVQDFIENVVIKIYDEPELDILLSAWSLTYEEGIHDVCFVKLEGVEIPYLGIDSLIKSKQTAREQDVWDIKVLTEIKNKRKK